jgi:hypothetical protein
VYTHDFKKGEEEIYHMHARGLLPKKAQMYVKKVQICMSGA